MKQTRPFAPTLDKLCVILDVSNPGDLPDAVQELKKELEMRRRWTKAMLNVLKASPTGINAARE